MAVVVAVVNRRYRLTVTGSGFVPIPGTYYHYWYQAGFGKIILQNVKSGVEIVQYVNGILPPKIEPERGIIEFTTISEVY